MFYSKRNADELVKNKIRPRIEAEGHTVCSYNAEWNCEMNNPFAFKKRINMLEDR